MAKAKQVCSGCGIPIRQGFPSNGKLFCSTTCSPRSANGFDRRAYSRNHNSVVDTSAEPIGVAAATSSAQRRVEKRIATHGKR